MIVSIILAAGEGTRMLSDKPKVLHKICGKSLAGFVVDACKKAGIEKNVLVLGHGKEKVKKAYENTNLVFVEQAMGDGNPYGTGFAVKCAIGEISDEDRVIVLNGDTPLIDSETLKKLLNYKLDENLAAIILTAKFENPFGYGRIVRDEFGNVERIVEEKDASEAEKNICEVNSGIYVFDGKKLKECINKISCNNAKNEMYLTDIIEILKSRGEIIGAYMLEDKNEIFGINSKVELAEAARILREKINREFMASGVILIDPASTYIDVGVKIGRDTIIYPGSFIEGKTSIGEGVEIIGSTRIVNSEIGDGSHIESSLIEDSKIGAGVKLGPYAHIRPNSTIEDGVKVGNFVEVKNSTLQSGTKASHLTYIGDADVGRDVNFGCGTITVNYDGKNKFRTKIEDGAFIGCNANLIAPVEIGKDAFIAAGSTITDKVSGGELAIARSKQKNIIGWVKKVQKEDER
ncbi:UDP-N-acetylglucosamine diphosphorylase/glucosamine-1-phosphate N-acetyltransferase [Clostridiales bacterium KA00134]|nr:UDP-N-acetylglucosamine diphosphorylase/glucosamine-1-phosphate N-acetyltransferase [Clostridiales bacterium KA00134]